jgi:hypothetical protein
MGKFIDENENQVTTNNLLYIGVSALAIFGVVYLVGRAWKKSQTA